MKEGRVKHKKLLIVLLIVVLCLLVIGGTVTGVLLWNASQENDYLGNLSLNYRMTLDQADVDQDELSYFYGMAINSYINTAISYFGEDYESIIPFTFENGINSLEDQTCTLENYTDKSWTEYFLNTAAANLLEAEVLYQQAVQEGVQLEEADYEEIELSIKNIEEYCEKNDILLKDYLRSMYGKNATLDSVKKYTEKTSLVAKYTMLKANEIDVNESEYTAYYNENKNEIDTVTLRYFAFAKTDENKKAAEEFRKEITSEESFIELAKKYCTEELAEDFAEDSATLREGVALADMPEYISSWAFASERKAGETTILESDESYDVVLFVSRNVDDYDRVSLRLIQVNAAESSDKTSVASFEKAKAQAEELLEMYNAGEKTEESFAEMAKEYSDDTLTKDDGGLCTDLSKTDVVSSAHKWCFEEKRKAGDTVVVSTTNGYSVLYFVEYEKPDNLMTARAIMRSDLYDEAISQLIEAHEYEIIRK